MESRRAGDGTPLNAWAQVADVEARGMAEYSNWRREKETERRKRYLLKGLVTFGALSLMGLAAISGWITPLDGHGPSSLNLRRRLATVDCSETYGFFPCSDSVGGNIMLMLGYGFMMLVAAKLISDGSELLLQVLDPGLIGGLLLPVLGALPDTLLIIVSCVSGTSEEAASEVLTGMGVLAGSTIMMLTVAWSGSLGFGRCDLVGPNGTAKDRTLTPGWNLLGTGVTTDEQTRIGAWIMIVSAIPFIVVQIPLIFDVESSDGSTAAFIGMITCFVFLILYCLFQVFAPNLQEMRIQNARLTYIRTSVLRNINVLAAGKEYGSLMHDDGTTPNVDTLGRIFDEFDVNHDNELDEHELKGLIFAMGASHGGAVPEADELVAWLKDFDKDANGKIGKEEFIRGMGTWISKIALPAKQQTKRAKLKPLVAGRQNSVLANAAKDAEKALALVEEAVVEEEEDEEENKEPLTRGQVIQQAIWLLFLGSAVAAIFADPLVDAIDNFATVTGISSFYVSFVVAPIASNASELVSSFIFAMKKRKRTISLTYSQVYGAVTMNNTLCLGVFLAIVYFRSISWEYSSEVTIILAVTVIVGLIGGSRSTFPTLLAFIVISLYPLSLVVVYILDNVVGWS
eukprot:TRINITY_DN6718_c0_g1_i1.p1 TRINITY_DN6718_c0_g1~~TRINITY_DN6718_c0_g1_i1.p1  ORF type:complete len:627 (-),score=84.68 TRINITY_DN6718_c0_g1_i1:441-2321(-)